MGRVKLTGYKKLRPNRYSHIRTMDSFGRIWHLNGCRLCQICGQPDDYEDCNHKKLSNKEVLYMFDEATQQRQERG